MRSAEENNLEKDLKRWFSKLQKRVQKLIDTYYEDELFVLHVNKVYTIVEDMKPEYNAILLKHGLNVFYNAREVATTLYTIQQKKVSSKASLYEPKIIRPEDMGLFRTNPQIEDSLRYNTFVASDTTLARVTNNITNNLADSYHEGVGIKDAGRRINKEFSSLKGWESKRIARTEINSAQNVGSFSTYDELGVEYHMWWTGLDERVRDSHEDLHGHIVAVGNTFKNGLLHPGDKAGKPKEYMNCRCTSIPYIIPLGLMVPPGMSEFTEADLIPIDAKPRDFSELIENALREPHEIFNETQFNKLQSNEEIAEFFGYEYTPNGKSFENIGGETFEFYDPKNDCTLRFFKDKTNRMDNVDFTNQGKELYNLRDILRLYEESDMKKHVGSIDFGVEAHYNGVAVDMRERGQHHINISKTAMDMMMNDIERQKARNVSEIIPIETLEHTLLHEMGHCKEFDKKLTEHTPLGFSHQMEKEWKKATQLDYKHQREIGMEETTDTSSYGANDSMEDRAEMFAVVANLEKGRDYQISTDLRRVKVQDPNTKRGVRRRDRLFSEIKELNPNRYALAKKWLNTI